MSVTMDWVCVVKQDGKHLHVALGFTPEEARGKAVIWCDKNIDLFPTAVVGVACLQFPKLA